MYRGRKIFKELHAEPGVLPQCTFPQCTRILVDKELGDPSVKEQLITQLTMIKSLPSANHASPTLLAMMQKLAELFTCRCHRTSATRFAEMWVRDFIYACQDAKEGGPSTPSTPIYSLALKHTTIDVREQGGLDIITISTMNKKFHLRARAEPSPQTPRGDLGALIYEPGQQPKVLVAKEA